MSPIGSDLGSPGSRTGEHPAPKDERSKLRWGGCFLSAANGRLKRKWPAPSTSVQIVKDGWKPRCHC